MPNILSPKMISQIHQAKQNNESKHSVSNTLGIDYGTVRKWWDLDAPVIQLAEIGVLKTPQYRFESDSGYQYLYLLGLYLGDGYINLQNKKYGVYKIRIEQDLKYPQLIKEHMVAISDVLGTKSNTFTTKGGKSTSVYGYSKTIPELFPQHGKGLKHLRSITLADWQQEMVQANPKPFIRGLIQSDGSRYIQTVKSKSGVRYYVKYNFTNTSSDIVKLFCDSCDNLGLHYTMHKRKSLQPSDQTVETGAIKTTVTFNKKQDVEFLDTFVGPKM